MEDVVVVGAGWAGLAAAHRLRALGKDPVVLDGHTRAGGAAATVRDGPWLLEAGPHAFFPTHPALALLATDAGVDMAETVVAAPPAADRYVLHKGRRVALPRSPAGLVRTPLLRPGEKLRALAEPWVRRRTEDDESVAGFVERRFGRGLRALADAAVSGVYAGDPARLSVQVAFPRLAAAESAHGSVLRGLVAGRGAGRGPLAAPRDGMGAWSDLLASPLRVRFGLHVLRVEGEGPYTLVLDNGVIEARRVVLALPPAAAAEVLGVQLPPFPHAPVACVGMGWKDAKEVARAFDGYGVLYPEREGRFSLGVLYESSLFPGRAPIGGVLVRALVGGRRHPERVSLDDATLVRRAVQDLLEVHGVPAPPDWVRVVRPPPIPQPELGHAARVAPLLAAVASRAGVAVAGWGWGGAGITDAVASGQRAADEVAAAQ